MDKHSVAQVFEQVAACLELKGESPFRVRAYRTAAKALAQFPGDLAQALADGTLGEMKGVGPATIEIVRELLTGGRSSFLDELREQVPPGLVEMLRISGLGVAKVRQIHAALGIESLGELEAAARDGRLAKLPRFGPKTADNILKGLVFLRQASEFRLFHHARDEAEALERALREVPGIGRVEVGGAVRRRLEVIRDLDFVVVYDGSRADLLRRLGEAPGVTEFADKDHPLVTLRFASGAVAEVTLSPAEHFGAAWVWSTGSPQHIRALAELASAGGLRLDARGALRDGAPVPTLTEEAVYAQVGLPWIPPELREGLGECDAARAGKLPRLVQRSDLKGLLHCHSNYSDGTSTIADWAEACRRAGYSWIGITDHSGMAAYAGGLKAEDVPRQHAEVDQVNARYGDVRVLKGVEADILADGTLDYGAPVLDRFDFVIGSIHSRFGMTEAEMTARVLKAMDDPHMTILGHPTGRLLLSRDPYPIALARVFAKAAERGIAIEVNTDPHRLDLDWRTVREARAMGVTISIGADAHSTAGMGNVDMGLGMARKGWLEAGDVLNTRSADEFLAFAKQRR